MRLAEAGVGAVVLGVGHSLDRVAAVGKGASVDNLAARGKRREKAKWWQWLLQGLVNRWHVAVGVKRSGQVQLYVEQVGAGCESWRWLLNTRQVATAAGGVSSFGVYQVRSELFSRCGSSRFQTCATQSPFVLAEPPSARRSSLVPTSLTRQVESTHFFAGVELVHAEGEVPLVSGGEVVPSLL